jgi:hypothetical protein
VLRSLAAASPSVAEIEAIRTPSYVMDADLNHVAFRLRWSFLMAAERAGAAHQIDVSPDSGPSM